MKKIILQNNEDICEINYIISKNKYAYYYKVSNYKSIKFFKKQSYHRLCNIGPQFRDKWKYYYIENDQCHNLYGYAYINTDQYKEYWIYGKIYTKEQFFNYLSIYNNLSYKRTYV